MKRRLKSEVLSKKKITEKALQEEPSKEFEESLMKLANLAKGRVKFQDFTSKDRYNILDLFVNNEKTLIKIYEVLFPNRMSMMSSKQSENAVGTYGYISGMNK